MRIDDDGSHSVERAKVFIYDLGLLLNERTAARHPGILIHDNIFEVDQDTLANSLKFITEKAILSDEKQYILTLNADRIETFQNETWYANLDNHVRARFTKQHRFLKAKYQETQKAGASD